MLQKSILNVLMPLLANSRAIIRKRTIAALGNLALVASDDVFTSLHTSLLANLKVQQSKKDVERVRTLVNCYSTLVKSCPGRLAGSATTIVDAIIEFVEIGNDEVKECCVCVLEAFVTQVPLAMTSYVSVLVELVCTNIQYDPNHIEQDGNDDMDIDSEDGSDNGEYSDAEDQSWSVRRGAARLLQALISFIPSCLFEVYNRLSKLLIERFSEGEESVRIDILQAFILMVRATNPECIESVEIRELKRKRLDTDEQLNPLAFHYLQSILPSVFKELSTQLKNKSSETTDCAILHLLKEIALKCGEGLSEVINEVSGPLKSILVSRATDSQIKLASLEFIKIFTRNSGTNARSILDLVPALVKCLTDSSYKVATSAMEAIAILIKALHPYPDMVGSLVINASENSLIQVLNSAIWQIIESDHVDTEIKAAAFVTICTLYCHSGNYISLDEVRDKFTPLLMNRVQSDVLRGESTRMIIELLESPILLHTGGFFSALGLHVIAVELENTLGSSRSDVITSSLTCMESLIVNGCFEEKVADYVRVIRFLADLFNAHGDNIVLISRIFSVCSVIVECEPRQETIEDCILSQIISNVVRVVVESPHFFSGDAARDSLVRLWSLLANFKNQTKVSQEVSKLMNQASNNITNEACLIIAKCVCAAFPSGQTASLIETLLGYIGHAMSDTNYARLGLYCLGEIGHSMYFLCDDSDLSRHAPELHLIAAQKRTDAAAFCMGNIVLGNTPFYLNIVMEKLGKPEEEYFYLQALSEFCGACIACNYQTLVSVSREIWSAVFSRIKPNVNESKQTLIVEIMGKISNSIPNHFVPLLIQSTISDNDAIRKAALETFSYNLLSTNSDYNSMICQNIMAFVGRIGDPIPDIRKAALSVLQGLLHTKSDYLVSNITEVIALLYGETQIRVC